jgi:type II secretory pathway pseudopilin PulG
VTRSFGRRGSTARGLTLLEVVIALMLFALMSTVLLSGQGTAATSIEKAEAMRDMAELCSFRLNMASLQPDEYEDGDGGEFPALGKSTRLVDEEEVLGTRYEGYTWEVRISETVGSGAGGNVSIEGGDPLESLFPEEGATATEEGFESDEPEEELQADEVDRMLLIVVTVFPPNWDESQREDEEAIQPRTAWTAIPLPTEEDTEDGLR